MQRTFLCVIEGRDDSWEATCLDLDIAVAGTSFDGAKHDLERAVAQYVQAALQESPADRERLLARQAPLGLRLRLLWHLVSRILRRRDAGRAGGTVLLPCHV
jgi:hypothetical protein